MQPCRLLAVTTERSGSVAETDPGVRRHARDVGPVLAAIRYESYPVVSSKARETRGKWEVGMHDENLVGTCFGECLYSRCNRAVQSETGLLQQQRSTLLSPRGHFRVVTDDSDGERRCRGKHMLRHGASKQSTLRRVQSRREPCLGGCETLHG